MWRRLQEEEAAARDDGGTGEIRDVGGIRCFARRTKEKKYVSRKRSRIMRTRKLEKERRVLKEGGDYVEAKATVDIYTWKRVVEKNQKA